MHAAGARLVLVARSLDALARTGAELGSRTFAIACDMAEPDSVQAALQKILGRAPVCPTACLKSTPVAAREPLVDMTPTGSVRRRSQ